MTAIKPNLHSHAVSGGEDPARTNEDTTTDRLPQVGQGYHPWPAPSSDQVSARDKWNQEARAPHPTLWEN